MKRGVTVWDIERENNRRTRVAEEEFSILKEKKGTNFWNDLPPKIRKFVPKVAMGCDAKCFGKFKADNNCGWSGDVRECMVGRKSLLCPVCKKIVEIHTCGVAYPDPILIPISPGTPGYLPNYVTVTPEEEETREQRYKDAHGR